VKDAIRGRELIALEALGVTVHGTCHLPHDEVSGSRQKLRNTKATGGLFLSGLLSPRAAIGDSAVYWADSLAKYGYRSVRVDLPGSCDSGGDAPAERMNFIVAGDCQAVTVEILKQSVVRYNLSSFVIMGHCTGSVTALFSAANCKDCKGLILMEPYFHILPPVATKTREALSGWAGSNRLGGFLSNLFDRLKELRLRLRRNELPANANFQFIKHRRTLASARVPILMLRVPAPKASGAKPRPREFAYLSHVMSLAPGRSEVVLEVVEGAAHSFADPIGRVAVRRHTEDWLNKHFPLPIAKPVLSQDEKLPSMEINPVTLRTPVPAYVSSGEMGAV
jgi:pimeloyl-ACP methyl ester carboxylesterase